MLDKQKVVGSSPISPTIIHWRGTYESKSKKDSGFLNRVVVLNIYDDTGFKLNLDSFTAKRKSLGNIFCVRDFKAGYKFT